MKKEYSQIADKMITAMGGKDNIIQVFHCMTRLRFYVKSKGKMNEDAILKLEEVSGVNWYNDQFQVIVGNEVDAVYKALIEKGVPSEDTVGESTNKDASVLSTVVDSITGCMTPMIPALTAAGMIKVVLTLLTTFHLVQDSSSTYQVIDRKSVV